MTYEARQRGPLIDDHSRRMLEQRAKEIIGLCMLGVGGAMGLMLATYSKTDPGLFTANDLPVKNLFGETGATIASPLMVTIGISSWFFVIFLVVWGLRFMSHLGDDRFVGRLLFLPFAVVSLSIFLAVIGSRDWWLHNFGIGGMFGDTALGAIIYSWPTGIGGGEQYTGHVIAAICALFAFLALGLNLGELKSILGVQRVFAGLRRRDRDPEVHGRKRGFWRRAGLEHVRVRQEPEFVINDDGVADDGAGDGATSGRKRGFPFLRRKPASRDRRSDHWGGGGSVRRVTEPPISRADDIPPPPPEEDRAVEEPEFVPPPAETLVIKQAPARQQPQRRPAATAGPVPASRAYEAPPLSLLQKPTEIRQGAMSRDALQENAALLKAVLEDYGVNGEISAVQPGPVVTLYELLPEPGLKASRVMGLSDDIARNMSALSARISTVPGKQIIGIELPNESRETVYLRELLSHSSFGDSNHDLPITLGKDIGGQPMIVDLAAMPHLLIAGTTGSGKSVAINTMILSLLYRQSPEECRMIMIDPKMLELSVYDGIPHLLAPVVTDPRKAVFALKWVVSEMEDRYRKMSKMGVRKLSTYNERVTEAKKRGRKFTRMVQTGFDEATGEPTIVEQMIEPETLPYIVVIVDEMADLMMAAGKEIEACIQRLAQMARASGIHVVLATQRPSVDVITGTIKANIPIRASFQVASKIDSRTILGEQGAEQLLGRGDMLFMSGGSRVNRVHGPFVDDTEVEQIVSHLKSLGTPEYLAEIVEGPEEGHDYAGGMAAGRLGNSSSDDREYDMAVQVIKKDRKCSTSYIQRKLGIGYNKAARLVERMEEEGLVSAPNHVGKRQILVPEG